MFKDVPWSNQARNFEEQPEPPQGSDLLLPFMEKHNIEIAMIGVGHGQERSGAREAIEQYPDRFIGCHEPDPNDVMGSIATIRELHEKMDTSKQYLHFQPEETLKYQSIPRCTRCTRYVLNWIPIFCCAGTQAVPFEAQHVKLIDDVINDFPDQGSSTRM